MDLSEFVLELISRGTFAGYLAGLLFAGRLAGLLFAGRLAGRYRADCVISYADGRRHAFSHIVIFVGSPKSAKIKAIGTYLVDLQEDSEDGTGSPAPR